MRGFHKRHASKARFHLIVYGHKACGLSLWLKRVLTQQGIEHEWRDVRSGEPRFAEELTELAHGNLSVPTVIFPDGKIMVEPQPDQVLDELRPHRSKEMPKST